MERIARYRCHALALDVHLSELKGRDSRRCQGDTDSLKDWNEPRKR